MPKVYRSMRRADDGLPTAGSNSKELGVREPPNPAADVDLDENRIVILNGRGMSVVQNWRQLPLHLVPKRLRTTAPGATGANTLACWTMGEGEFAAGALTENVELSLKRGNSRGGNVTPSLPVSIDQFQRDLSATRNLWILDET